VDDVEPVFRRIESGPMQATRTAEPDEVSCRFVAAAQAAGVAPTTTSADLISMAPRFHR
jgi:choline dehydrogenase